MGKILIQVMLLILVCSSAASAAVVQDSSTAKEKDLRVRFRYRLHVLTTSKHQKERTLLLKQALEKFPNDPTFLLEQYRAFVIQRRYEQALSVCKHALNVVPVQVVPMSYHNELGVQNIDWNFLCAETFFALERYEECIKACDGSITQMPGMWTFKPYLLKSEALSKLGRTTEARDAFDTGAYLDADVWYSFDMFGFVIKKAAKPLGLVDDMPRLSCIQGFGTGLKIPMPVARTENVPIVLNKLEQLEKLQAPNTVQDFRSILPLGKELVNSPERECYVGLPNSMIRFINFSKIVPYRHFLTIEIDPLFATVTSKDITEKFGPPDQKLNNFAPPISSSQTQRINSLRYTTSDYEATFLFSNGLLKPLRTVEIRWIDEGEKHSITSEKEYRQRYDPDQGSNSNEMIRYVFELTKMRTPTVASLEELFGKKLIPVRRGYAPTWMLGQTDVSKRSPSEPDFNLVFSPNGTAGSDIQLVLKPGFETHKISRAFTMMAFKNPRFSYSNNSKDSCAISFHNVNGTVLIVFESPGDPNVQQISYWCRGAHSEKTLDEYEKKRKTEIILTEADDAIRAREFRRARFLIDSAYSRGVEITGLSMYQSLQRLRDSYKRLFVAMHRTKAVEYLNNVSISQMSEDLGDLSKRMVVDEFPSIDDWNRDKWTLSFGADGYQFAQNTGRLGPQVSAPEDIAECRRLYGSEKFGTKILDCPPPAKLLDSIYFGHEEVFRAAE